MEVPFTLKRRASTRAGAARADTARRRRRGGERA